MRDHEPIQTQYFDKLIASFPSMQGKTVAITGCSSGMGLILARACGEHGARIVMLNRPSKGAQAALEDIQRAGINAIGIECDLSSFEKVRHAGAELRRRLGDSGCDVLCNNAGVMGLEDLATEDGFDVQMQTNHLSHFLLTHEVWPLLEKAEQLRGEARVVNHSSGARRAPSRPLQAKYLQAKGGRLGGNGLLGFNKWVRYQQSKLANLMFTYALHEHAGQRPDNRIKSLCAHPGPTDSGLQGKTASSGGTLLLDRYILSKALKNAHSAEDGTCGLARCVMEPGVESGAFFGPEGQSQPGPAVLLPSERDPAAEALLWDESLKATGIRNFFEESVS
ncbi:MAG: SDR family NAD(P)-dependent oxidoreductase [Alphaproteobacteria bacterium]|nr:SDR family NAD(P)-dependent oxidoreductase [Alphaproteobacteria bacterium]MBU2085856.1 SDR family NAD(P)-dependent oxidoreductase [Alphaproteobacteria bacterium]